MSLRKKKFDRQIKSKIMKKVIYFLSIPLLVMSVIVYANREIIAKKSVPKPPTAAEKAAAIKAWEATPSGIYFRLWEGTPRGKKIIADAAKIKRTMADQAEIEAVVSALKLPSGSRLGLGVMVNINDSDYILSFGPDITMDGTLKEEYKPLHSLKVQDKIMIKIGGVSKAPKYEYPILSGNYVSRNGRVIFEKAQGEGGC